MILVDLIFYSPASQVPKKIGKDVKKAIEPFVAVFEEEDWGINCTSVLLIDPGNYRAFEDKFQQQTRGLGNMEILDLKVQDEGDEVF